MAARAPDTATDPSAEPAVSPLERIDRGPVAWLWLNRRRAYNALSEALLDALARALDEIAADPSVRAVVIGSRGPAFCAGHDLREMPAEPTLDTYRDLFARCSRAMAAI